MTETTVGAQLSEILNEEIESEESGFSRRRVVKGVAWSVPVLVAAVGVPPASASPGQPTPPPVPAPTGIFFTAAQPLPTTHSGNHNRVNEMLPSKLSFSNLPPGEVTVALEVAPVPASTSAPGISFSKIMVGTTPIAVTSSVSGNKFTASFRYIVPTGVTTLEFLLSVYSYTGKTADQATYNFTAVTRYIKAGASTAIEPSPIYQFDLKKG